MELPVIVLFVAFAVLSRGAPIMDQNDLINAALSRNWDELHRLLEKYSNNKFQQISAMSSGEVRDLKPMRNGRFYAESESRFHHAVNDGEKVEEQSGGHMVINNNGEVKEYDFQPQKPDYSRI